jgi:hypothetical protein
LSFDILAFNLQPQTFFLFQTATPQHCLTFLQGTRAATASEMLARSPSMGTPLFQQTSLMDNRVPQKSGNSGGIKPLTFLPNELWNGGKKEEEYLHGD